MKTSSCLLLRLLRMAEPPAQLPSPPAPEAVLPAPGQRRPVSFAQPTKSENSTLSLFLSFIPREADQLRCEREHLNSSLMQRRAHELCETAGPLTVYCDVGFGSTWLYVCVCQ